MRTFLHEEFLLDLRHFLLVLVFLEQLLCLDSHVFTKLVSHQVVSSHPFVIVQSLEAGSSVRFCAEKAVDQSLE